MKCECGSEMTGFWLKSEKPVCMECYHKKGVIKGHKKVYDRPYHWLQCSSHYWATEEQRDGTPDIAIFKEGRWWIIKTRTSACYQPLIFRRIQEAIKYANRIYSRQVPV